MRIALVVTVTFVFASATPAVLVQRRPRTPLPSTDSATVQPAGSVSVPLVLLATIASTSTSPASTSAGIRTVCAVRLPAVLADPTWVTSPSTA